MFMFTSNQNDGHGSEEIESRQTENAAVHTSLHFGNVLVGAGLEHILSGTCFTVVDSHKVIPSLYLVDGNEPWNQVLESVKAIKGQHAQCKVALIGGRFDLEMLRSGNAAGVDGFCLTASSREIPIGSLELVMLGEPVLPGSMVNDLLTQKAQAAPEATAPVANETTDPKVLKLSPRERAILQSIMSGDPNKVIARKLDVAEATVKVHVKAILRKIGAANRTQAAMWAAGHLGNGSTSNGRLN